MIILLKLIFSSSLFIILYTYCGYLFCSVLLGILFRIKREKQEFTPSLTVIVPCYNEENVIQQKIENLLSLEYPRDKLQIIIASESSDKTNKIATRYKERGIELLASELRRGKTVLMYHSIAIAHGDIIVFSDANVLLKQNALLKVTRNFSDTRVGAVIGMLQVTNPKASHISRGEYIYKQYETTLRESNSNIGSVLNADGALFAIRKSLYKPLSPERGDDFELVIRILLQGYLSVFDREAIAYEDASLTSRQEISRKIRMTSWFVKSSLLLSREMVAKARIDLLLQLISHKFLRWFTPYFLILAFCSNLFLWREAASYRIFFIVQCGLYLLGLSGVFLADVRKKKPPLIMGAMHYFLMYNYAFLIGTIKGMGLGKTSSTWE